MDCRAKEKRDIVSEIHNWSKNAKNKLAMEFPVPADVHTTEPLLRRLRKHCRRGGGRIEKSEDQEIYSRTSSIILNKYGESEQPCLVPDFNGIAFVYMVYYIDRFSYVEPSLHLWDEAYLIMVDNFLELDFFLLLPSVRLDLWIAPALTAFLKAPHLNAIKLSSQESSPPKYQFILILVLSDLDIHKCSFNIYIFTYLK
ncbi:hypothetical protein STEG23_037946, partial [Scotinomys teguina]